MASSSCINLEPHDYKIVRKTWQTVNALRYQVLDHSEEKIVCMKCGETIDPFSDAEKRK